MAETQENRVTAGKYGRLHWMCSPDRNSKSPSGLVVPVAQRVMSRSLAAREEPLYLGNFPPNPAAFFPVGFWRSSTGPFMLEPVTKEWLVAEVQEGQMTLDLGKISRQTHLL